MTIVVLSVSMVFGMSAAYGQAVLTVETDETIYSDGNKILITTVLQKHSEPPNVVTLIISNPDGGNAHFAQLDDIILESPKTTIVIFNVQVRIRILVHLLVFNIIGG